jgi:hypothetical protein
MLDTWYKFYGSFYGFIGTFCNVVECREWVIKKKEVQFDLYLSCTQKNNMPKIPFTPC